MNTKIANVKVAHIRKLGYFDLKQWMEDPQNVYVGRKGVVFITNNDDSKQRWPPKDSVFANPYKINECNDRTMVIDMYRKYIINRLQNEHELKTELDKLKGKTLGCWCFPESCHAQVLIDLLNI